jgi:hypothetical protein
VLPKSENKAGCQCARHGVRCFINWIKVISSGISLALLISRTLIALLLPVNKLAVISGNVISLLLSNCLPFIIAIRGLDRSAFRDLETHLHQLLQTTPPIHPRNGISFTSAYNARLAPSAARPRPHLAGAGNILPHALAPQRVLC